MEKRKNRALAVAYQLYINGENGLEKMEETTADKPFRFITGFGVALDAFEQNLVALPEGESFDFVIEKEQAYGDYLEENVLSLKREDFFVDGKFDSAHVYEDAVIPLQNEEGQRFFGQVVEVGEQTVKIDLNHPLVGEALHFKGVVVENREATAKEIEQMVKHLAGGCGGCHGKGGGCGSCGDGCEGGCHDGNDSCCSGC